MKPKSNNLMLVMLYLSVFLIPFYIFRFRILALPTNVFEITIFISFIIYIISNYRNKTKVRFSALDWTIFAFVLFSFIAIFFSPNKADALGIVKSWFVVPAIFYFILSRSIAHERVDKLSVPLFFALAFVTIWSFLQKYGIIGAVFYQRGDTTFNQFLFENVRTFGPFESPNFLAMFIVPVLLLCLPLIGKMKDIFSKFVMAVLFVAPVIILLSSKSRGGLVAFIAGLLVIALISVSRVINPKFTRVFSAAIGALAAIGSFITYKLGFDLNRDYARLDIYHYSLQMIKSNGIFGIGFSNFQNKIDTLSMGNERFQTFVLAYALHPHNVFLAMWLYLGIGGVITFLLILWQFFRKIFQNISHPYSPYVGAAMVAVLVHGSFDTTYFKNDLSAIFFLILAMAAIISSKSKTGEINAK